MKNCIPVLCLWTACASPRPSACAPTPSSLRNPRRMFFHLFYCCGGGCPPSLPRDFTLAHLLLSASRCDLTTCYAIFPSQTEAVVPLRRRLLRLCGIRHKKVGKNAERDRGREGAVATKPATDGRMDGPRDADDGPLVLTSALECAFQERLQFLFALPTNRPLWSWFLPA